VRPRSDSEGSPGVGSEESGEEPGPSSGEPSGEASGDSSEELLPEELEKKDGRYLSIFMSREIGTKLKKAEGDSERKPLNGDHLPYSCL